MSTDTRLWAKIDLGYLSNPKMSDVLDASSNAVCMHLASILHSAQHLTDGHVSPKAMQRAVGGSDEDTEILTAQGLWHAPGHDCEECPQPEPGRVYVHNYLNHNISSDKVQQQSDNARKAANARWNKRRKSTTQDNADSNASRMQGASESHANRMQDAMPNAMLDRSDRSDRSETNTSDSADAEPRPDIESVLDRIDQHCEAHDFKKPNRTKANVNAARLMLDKDERTLDQVNWIMDWVTSHHFWAPNIRSAAKLREQFDQLKGQALANRQPQQHMTASQRRLQEGYEREQRILNGELSFDNTDNPYMQPRPQRQAIEGGTIWTPEQQ